MVLPLILELIFRMHIDPEIRRSASSLQTQNFDRECYVIIADQLRVMLGDMLTDGGVCLPVQAIPAVLIISLPNQSICLADMFFYHSDHTSFHTQHSSSHTYPLTRVAGMAVSSSTRIWQRTESWPDDLLLQRVIVDPGYFYWQIRASCHCTLLHRYRHPVTIPIH